MLFVSHTFWVLNMLNNSQSSINLKLGKSAFTEFKLHSPLSKLLNTFDPQLLYL